MYHTITRVVVFVRERSNNDFANIKNLTSSFNCKFLDLDHLYQQKICQQCSCCIKSQWSFISTNIHVI